MSDSPNSDDARFRRPQPLPSQPMPDVELTREVIEVATRLIEDDRMGEIGGADVASQIDRPEIDLYYAFKEAQRQGALDCYFPGGMGLPSIVRRT